MQFQQPKNIRRFISMNRNSHSVDKRQSEEAKDYNDYIYPNASQEIVSTSPYASTEYEEGNTKIKEEAKLLIAKTRQIMDEMNATKATKDRPVSKERINLLSNSTPSVNHLSQKLLDKTKKIKLLEKELKDKNAQLRLAQDKLQTKNEEITKLNEALTLERSNILKAENAKLQRKIFSLEKANEENKKIYERLIEDYKNKINQSSECNKDQEVKIKEIEQNNKKMIFEVNKLQSNVHLKENMVKELTDKIDIEKKVTENKMDEIEGLKGQLGTLVAIVKSLFEKEVYRQNTTSSFLQKIHCLVDDNNLMKSGMSSQSDYGYDRTAMNNIDYQQRYSTMQNNANSNSMMSKDNTNNY